MKNAVYLAKLTAMKRRESLQMMAAAAAVMMMPKLGCSPAKDPDDASSSQTDFRFCLNTSTIQGQQLGLKQQIELAARAGYDGLELWVRDVQAFLEEGNSPGSLHQFIRDNGLEVYNAIGFAPWLSDQEEVSEAGFAQMREEMNLMAGIGCTRIAAAAAGRFDQPVLDLFRAGEKYRQLIGLGRETGVMPQLEFWGASKVLFHIGQALMIAAVANDPDVRIMPDIYHMFRGQSGFDSLKMLNGKLIEVFHINDYPGNIPREEQTDADRVFPGDGAAPMAEIVSDLKAMCGLKILSLELFNRTYWEQDAEVVAISGLNKMRELFS
jgi:2-keto-myo-inositol isomerase